MSTDSERIAELEAENAAQAGVIKTLESRILDLERQLSKHSGNSHKPPSSDSFSQKKKRRKKKPTGRKRGGQPGHPGHHRKLVSESEVDQVVDVYAKRCEMCLHKVPQVPTPHFDRHQVVDVLPDGKRFITEYRHHFFRCDCGEMTLAEQGDVPTSAFGPRLKSVVAQLTGSYHLSRRDVPKLLSDIFGISISLGSVSNIEAQMSVALEKPCEAALQAVESSEVVHIDETSFAQCHERQSLWVFASPSLTVFRILKDGTRRALREVFNLRDGVMVSDRASVFLDTPMVRRQICWSHLLRLFVSFFERDGPAHLLGKELLEHAHLVFVYWREFCSGVIDRERLLALISALQVSMRTCLQRGVDLGVQGISGSCENLLQHFEAMWTFVSVPGVEPTNNHAERELRRMVLWRKRSFGSQSARGSRFAERIMTVQHSLKKQGRHVLDFLSIALNATLSHMPSPSLLPV